MTVYGPDVAKVVPGKVYTFSAEVSCAVEGYDIVWSVYCSDETVKASIVDGELYVTENPTGEDQVLRIRARYKDADGNLLIVHCSGGANGVVITGSAGFTSVARPDRFET